MNKRLISIAILMFSSISLGVGFGSNATVAVAPAPAIVGATVTLSNFQFAPKTVRIKAGGSVTWVVKEGTHTINADDGSFQSSNLSAGQKYSHQFDSPGTYRYYCSFHGSAGGHDMAGTVIVIK